MEVVVDYFTSLTPEKIVSDVKDFAFDWRSVDSNAKWSQLWSPNDFEFEYGVTPFAHYTVLIKATFLYFAGIQLLQLYMAKRPKINVDLALYYHNLFLCFFSTVCTSGMLFDAILVALRGDFYTTLFCDQTTSPYKGRLWWWGYWYFLSKFYELFDTPFHVFKKHKIIFLHYWHHSIMTFCTFWGIQGKYGLALWTAVIFNSGVHIMMYYYYAISIYRKNIWWKSWVTRVQIIQFWIGLSLSVAYFYTYQSNWVFTPENGITTWSTEYGPNGGIGKIPFFTFNTHCSAKAEAVIPMNMINFSFLFLFTSFFNKTYKPKKDAKKGVESKPHSNVTESEQKKFK